MITFSVHFGIRFVFVINRFDFSFPSCSLSLQASQARYSKSKGSTGKNLSPLMAWAGMHGAGDWSYSGGLFLPVVPIKRQISNNIASHVTVAAQLPLFNLMCPNLAMVSSESTCLACGLGYRFHRDCATWSHAYLYNHSHIVSYSPW